MDFKDLSYILAIARHQNITKAAESLYISQPALSKFLKAQEEELGIPLFRRMGHKYMLTYAGEQYVQKAKEILQIKKDLDMVLVDIIKRDVGVLRVAFPTMRCTYMLPAILPDFQRIYPNMKVDIIEDSSDNLDQKILNGEVEVAFYTEPPKARNPLLEFDVLKHEELLIITKKGHPLGRFARPGPADGHPRLDVALLKNERVIMMRPGQRTRQIMDDYLLRTGLQLDNVFYTSNLTAIMELASLGYGVAFVLEPHLRHWSGRDTVDCYTLGERRTTSNFVAAYRKGSYLPIYARDFIELTRKLCDNK